MKQPQVGFHYLRTLFIFDILSSIRCIYTPCEEHKELFFLIEVLCFLKFIRLKTLVEYIRKFLEVENSKA